MHRHSVRNQLGAAAGARRLGRPSARTCRRWHGARASPSRANRRRAPRAGAAAPPSARAAHRASARWPRPAPSRPTAVWQRTRRGRVVGVLVAWHRRGGERSSGRGVGQPQELQASEAWGGRGAQAHRRSVALVVQVLDDHLEDLLLRPRVLSVHEQFAGRRRAIRAVHVSRERCSNRRRAKPDGLSSRKKKRTRTRNSSRDWRH